MPPIPSPKRPPPIDRAAVVIPSRCLQNRPVLNILRYGLAALIAAFALLQFNDPDPLVWVAVYGLVAVCIVLPSGHSFGRRLSWLAGGMLLILGLETLQGVIDYARSGAPDSIFGEMSPDRPWVEPAREFLGIVIAGAALIAGRYRRNA